MKKKVGNRLIALLLALFMVVTMMPDMAVWAEETDNGVADEVQECGYEQPKAINVGELDEDEAEDLPIVRAQYNAADASYWAYMAPTIIIVRCLVQRSSSIRHFMM